MSKVENYVIIDCDCGSDDAWALLMMIKAEEQFKSFKILAITCVFGNTTVNNVAINVLRVLDSINRLDIPVYKGCSKPLLPVELEKTNCFHGIDGFGDLVFDMPLDKNLLQTSHAVNFIYELTCKYPGKINYIFLGPLTNLAACINMYNEDFSINVKKVFIMGGNIRGKGNATKSAEFNFYSDPEAAHISLAKLKKPITILPWEPCIEGEFNLTLEWRFNILGSINSNAMHLMKIVEEKILIPKGLNKWVICDAILTAVFLFPSKIILNAKHCHGVVEIFGPHTRGQLVLDHLKQKPNNICIIEDVDKDNFKHVISWTAGLSGAHIDWPLCL